MSFLNNRSLPGQVKAVLSPGGQQIWRTTFNAQQAQGVSDAEAEAAAWRELKQRGWTLDPQGNWNPPTGPTAKAADLPMALVKEDVPMRYTLGEVYIPDEVDSQGDFASRETIRDAAFQFLRRFQAGGMVTKRALDILESLQAVLQGERPIVRLDITDLDAEVTKARGLLGDQHQSWDERLGDLVESYLMPCTVMMYGREVVEGTWMLGVIWSPEYFAKIQGGMRTGYSIGGTGKRRAVPGVTKQADSSDLIGRLLKVLESHAAATPAAVHVHMPAVAMSVQTPEVTGVQVDVHVPEQAAPIINMPPQDAPVIHVAPGWPAPSRLAQARRRPVAPGRS